MTKQINLDLELRHIDSSKLIKLSAILDTAKAWDILLDAFSRPMPDSFFGEHRVEPLNLSLDNVDLIKQQFSCGKSPSLALLNHWSITGRRRPTVRTLLKYLHHFNLKWAEDHVKESILGMKPQIEQNHQHHDNRLEYINEPPKALLAPAQKDHSHHIVDDEFKFDDLQEIIANLEGDFKRYSFNSIYDSTNRFCHQPYDPKTKKGTRIGDGRFSSVFLAQSFVESSRESPETKQVVAAKLLKSECNRKYLANEINLARKISHENLLELLGISLGEGSVSGRHDFICLIYPYIQNGSLLECLTSGLPCQGMNFLRWDKRLEIAVKVARGVAYLHTFEEGSIIHRDIKTANILIDVDLQPKVGDFTLVRQLDTLRNTETQFSQNVIGTSVYMPPEAFRGDISTKFDTFSFGIVTFELLTGMRPFNNDVDEDLLTYISDRLSDIQDKVDPQDQMTLDEARNKFLVEILDKRADEWNFGVASELFNLALRATKERKKDRPELVELLPTLESTLRQVANL